MATELIAGTFHFGLVPIDPEPSLYIQNILFECWD